MDGCDLRASQRGNLPTVDGRQLQTIPCSTTTNDCGAFCVYAFTSRASNDYVGAEFEIPLTIPETSIDLIKLSL